MVHQRLADIERFKTALGGQYKLDQFIGDYVKVWKSGKIFKQEKMRDKPWLQNTKKKENAHELSKTKYV